MPTLETLYLQLLDLSRALDALKVRHDAMEDFIKEQYPGHFAGEVGTILDPLLKPVEFNTGDMVNDLRPDLPKNAQTFDNEEHDGS